MRQERGPSPDRQEAGVSRRRKPLEIVERRREQVLERQDPFVPAPGESRLRASLARRRDHHDAGGSYGQPAPTRHLTHAAPSRNQQPPLATVIRKYASR